MSLPPLLKSALVFSTSKRTESEREVSIERSAHALLSTAVQITFLLCMHSMSSLLANSAAQNAIWSVTTCCAVPLHKPSRYEPSQIHYYGVQTLSKLTQMILLLQRYMDLRCFLLHFKTLCELYRQWRWLSSGMLRSVVWYKLRLQGATYQKTVIFILAAVRTWNITCVDNCVK
jgi:hypothetical protein